MCLYAEHTLKEGLRRRKKAQYIHYKSCLFYVKVLHIESFLTYTVIKDRKKSVIFLQQEVFLQLWLVSFSP